MRWYNRLSEGEKDTVWFGVILSSLFGAYMLFRPRRIDVRGLGHGKFVMKRQPDGSIVCVEE